MSISSRSILKVLTLTLLYVAAVYVAHLVQRELIWIGTAFFLAIALNPAVEWFQKFMPKQSRGWATGAVFVAGMVFAGLMLAMFVPPLISQTEQLIAHAPALTDQVLYGNSWVAQQLQAYHLVDRIRESQSQIFDYVSSAGGSLWMVLTRVFSGFAAGLTVLGLTFFMLLEGRNWTESFWKLVAPRHRTRTRLIAQEMYGAVTGYVTGNALTSLLAAAATSIVLVIVGVPYAIPLGIAVGLFDLLPLVGATIGAVVVIVTSLFTSVFAAIVVTVFFVIYQQLENHVLQPLVYGRTVKMSPLSVLVSVLLGAGLGGMLGALVAIPIGASVQILVRDYTQTRRASR